MFSSLNYARNNKSWHIFVTDFDDVKFYPLNNKGDAQMLLSQYFKDVGLPTSLHMDNTKDMDVIKKRKKFLSEEGGIKKRCNEPHIP